MSDRGIDGLTVPYDVFYRDIANILRVDAKDVRDSLTRHMEKLHNGRYFGKSTSYGSERAAHVARGLSEVEANRITNITELSTNW